MVADFVSAEYGWLCLPDKSKEACIFFKAGKNREEYFTNEDIINQATTAMDTLMRNTFLYLTMHPLTSNGQIQLSLHTGCQKGQRKLGISGELFFQCSTVMATKYINETAVESLQESH